MSLFTMRYYWSWKVCMSILLVSLYQYSGCLACLEEERIALLNFKASVSPYAQEPLTTWVDSKGSDCCAWARIKCSNYTRRVIQLSLRGTTGNVLLNASLFLPFIELQHLDLSNNYLSELKHNEGFERLSKLKRLEVLNLGGNQFNSSILPSLGALTSLKTLDLSFQSSPSLVGSYSDFENLSKLKKLEVLNLNGNHLNNSIVPFLGAIPSLKTLDLSENQLEGSLSEFSQVFTNLRNLEALYFTSNKLNSFLPSHEFGNMSKLKILDLSENNFTGRGVPSSIFSLKSLEALSLRAASIKDTISGFCALENLRELDISANKFNGILPSCLSTLTSLRLVDFSKNQLSGNISPSLISNMKSLQYLSLSQNPFQGSFSGPSFVSPKFQLQYLALSDCNLKTFTTDLLKFLHNQYDLRYADISQNNIGGEFPSWLVENNTRLETLILGNNSLSGYVHFPPNRGGNLRSIDVSNNRFQGQIQTNIGHILSKVFYLNFSRNGLEGKIPPSVANMKSLVLLDLSNNNFSGELPENVALTCKNLSVLILSNNRLQGQIPPAFLNLTYMSILRLGNNQFTGNIASSKVGFLVLTTFDISKNNISGTIPTWIGNLTGLNTLVMGDNSFDGPVPLAFCKVDTLKFLDLSQNRLSGSIPSCLMSLPELRHLHLQGNKLTGSLQRDSPYSSSMLTLDVKHNNLSGSIPKWFGLLTNLAVLSLKGNRFSGPIPHEVCQMNRVGIMDFSHNKLSGTVPSCLSNITFGKTPADELASEDQFWWTPLTYQYTGLLRFVNSGLTLYVTYTQHEEVEFMSRSYKGDSLVSMSGIDLSSNHFTGDIPLALGSLTAIRALNLSRNQLTGMIPRTLSNLQQVESMDLSHNKLTGEIPSELTTIHTLAVFNVAYNNLSGRIPSTKGQFSMFGATSFEGNPLLCGPPLPKQCK